MAGRRHRRRHRWAANSGLSRLGTVVCALLWLPLAAGATPRSAPPGDPEELTRLDGPAADEVLRQRSQILLGDPSATLRAAREAVDQGDRSHAVWLLEQVTVRHPIVADHAALMQVRLLEEDGHSEWAARAARRALLGHQSSPLRSELNVSLGDALADLGDEEGAYAAWRAALDASRDDALKARVLLRVAASQERQALDEDAAVTYRLIWYSLPQSEEARIASHRLDVLDEYLGREMREATHWRRRGDRLFRARESEAAQAAFEQALKLGLKRSEADRTHKQIAHALFRQRRYPEAVIAFSALRQIDDIPIWRARSLARAGDVPKAIEIFEALGKDQRSAQSVRARFLAALLLDGRGYDERAAVHFKAVARSKSSGGMGDAADWRLGWGAYRRGQYDEAIAYFDRLIRRKKGDKLGQLRPRYWRARALERRGDPWASSEFTAIAREFPLSYYGWRARQRASDDGRRIARPKIPAGRDRLSPSQLERPRILLEAGLYQAARDEVRRISRSARGLDERLELARLATDAGDFYRAQRLVVDPYSEILARGPIPRYEELWWYAWPSAYQRLVDEATAGSESIDSRLVWSIMREESGYRAEVVSPVGARGLLQIMTETGERLARDTGLPSFAADDLFEPRTNIGLGSFYLSELSNRFAGRLAPAIASYNAGPDAVDDWELPALEDDDEWVEAIPFDQTRTYVRRVLRSLHAYRLLY